ncbi:MAG: CPBP family intramembrane metalloprotease [Desulfurococcales archaeon]|nr:CPBP family intramembrane metalloprotease [Desulfurococcales archaeon]
MIITILKAIGIWAVIFIPGGIAGSIASRIIPVERKILSGVTSQLMFITMSLVITLFFTDGLRLSGLQFSSCCVIRAVLYSGALAITITLTLIVVQKEHNYEPPFLPSSLIEAVIVAFLLAPFSEELMYRGVVEGYLLSNASQFIAILIPAILFSLMHIIPFRDAPKPVFATLLIGAFLLGLVAGYYRALSNSIIPAFASHSIMNVIGFLQYYWEKRIYTGKL